jgi:hypothetical protein
VSPLSPELQAAVAAQLEYYRDLGIYDQPMWNSLPQPYSPLHDLKMFQ